MKKRLLPLLLALALVCALLPASTLAAGDFQITDGVLTKYNGPGGDVVIPHGVTAIGDNVFGRCWSLTSVVIPDGVTSIGYYAFDDCESLTSVTIPNSVTSIEYGAFEDCESLTSVTIPNSVTSIGLGTFSYCKNLTSVTIPDSVTSIEDWMFRECSNLTSVVIPDSVTSIGDGAFSGCSNLTSVTIPNGVTSIGDGAFEECESLTSVVIPDGVTSIGSGVFAFCGGLTSMVIPDGVTDIGDNAFRDCDNLTSVTIPASVADIAMGELYQSFRDCDNLKTICGAEGSYAQLWAVDNGYTFKATLPPATTPGKTAYASTQNILVNGAPVEFQAYALKDENGNDTNYVKLRDVAYVLNGTSAQFNVGWDGQVTITTAAAYTANGSEMKTPYSGDRTYASADRSSVKLNSGTEYTEYMNTLLLKDADGNGYTYFKLRDLGTALGFTVDWSADKGIFIETK